MILSSSDYYAFGNEMNGRGYAGLQGYRYGFNGQEKLGEWNNDYDFGARIYDARLGKWLSLDPLQDETPGLTPYNFVTNNPITQVDINGETDYYYKLVLTKNECGETVLAIEFDRSDDGFGAAYTKWTRYLGDDSYYLVGPDGKAYKTRFANLNSIKQWAHGKTPDQLEKESWDEHLRGLQIESAITDMHNGFVQDAATSDIEEPGMPLTGSSGTSASKSNKVSNKTTNKVAQANTQKVSANANTVAIKQRALDIVNNSTTSDRQKNVLTVAVAEATNGQKRVILVAVNSSVMGDKKLMARIKSQLKPNEILVENSSRPKGHAEDNLFSYARRWGLTVKTIEPSRKFCADCEYVKNQNGASTTTGTTNKISRNRKK